MGVNLSVSICVCLTACLLSLLLLQGWPGLVLLVKVGMALATAWCNGRDQGQARVGIFGFSLLPEWRQNIPAGILQAIFLEGG